MGEVIMIPMPLLPKRYHQRCMPNLPRCRTLQWRYSRAVYRVKGDTSRGFVRIGKTGHEASWDCQHFIDSLIIVIGVSLQANKMQSLIIESRRECTRESEAIPRFHSSASVNVVAFTHTLSAFTERICRRAP